MPVPWSVPDLSAITAELITMIQNAIIVSPIPPFNVTVSGSMPQTVRNGVGGCQLSLYLLHVGRDPYWRNAPRDNPRALTNKQQALSLNLTYLLTAFAQQDFVAEQQAMSIALHCFHEQPLFISATEEFTISIEADTIDEMSRLWQAIVAPIRLSAVIKVGVVFISPSQVPPPVAPPPLQAKVAVGADLKPGKVPQLFGIATPITFIVPPHPPDQPPPPEEVSVVPGPTVATGGDTIVVGGSGLDQPSANDVYLGRLPGGPIWRVTNPWRRPPPPPPEKTSPNEIVLDLPSAYMAPGASTPTPPALMPPPGIYQLMVGDASPILATAIPIAIAARLTGVTTPPALLPDATGLYTVTGEGFTPGSTALALDTISLAAAGAPDPASGFFFIDAAGQTITFRRQGLQPGRYFLRIRVSGVECPPSWWVDVP
jgi:Pvc16 N-terminal domain